MTGPASPLPQPCNIINVHKAHALLAKNPFLMGANHLSLIVIVSRLSVATWLIVYNRKDLGEGK